jgi:UDP-N-acetylmuramyl pentapeptide synthase
MLELGAVSEAAHHDIGREAAALGIDMLVGVGPLSAHTVVGAREGGIKDVWAFDDNQSAAKSIPDLLCHNDVVLVKGSRGMRMELVVKALTKEEVADHA